VRVDRQTVQARWLMEIGRRLRDEYTDAAEQPAPVLERLVAQLKQLETNETDPEPQFARGIAAQRRR
jgi:hypothetical protein